jgi:pimeloyl-ACP methyl ester carboxylesterase
VNLLLPGITASRIATARLTVNVLQIHGRQGVPVVLVHGNVSSSLFWQRLMLELPQTYRPIAVDLRGFGDTDPEPVDATRGVRDYADDVRATLSALALTRVHLVGWSLGGGVVLQCLRDDPAPLASVTLVNPVSPYGFGGAFGMDGTPAPVPGLGSGGGTANPGFVAQLAAGDRSADSPLSPRQVLLAHYVKPPFVPEGLDQLVESMLSTRLGEDHYPGDFTTTDAWPGILAGRRGVLNTIAPNNFRFDDLDTMDPKPPVLWIRGTADVIVSDTSLYDFGHLGALGLVPGWPGAAQWPAQPMIRQTRAVLDRYAAAGGSYREVAIADAGHSPFLEKPVEFRTALLETLDGAS